MTPARFLLPLLCCIVVLGCFGSSDDESSDSPAEPAVDVQQVLEDAAAAIADLRSFHFELTQEDATIPIPPNLDLESAEGDVVLPDRLEAELETEVSGVNVSVDAIAIADQTWITNPFTREWQALGTDLREYADLAALVPALVPAIRDPVLAGVAELDGVAVYRVTGTTLSSDLQAALPFSLPNREVDVEVWFGQDDSLPRRVLVTGQLITDESDGAVRQIDLTRLNEPIQINPP